MIGQGGNHLKIFGIDGISRNFFEFLRIDGIPKNFRDSCSMLTEVGNIKAVKIDLDAGP